MLKIKKKNKKVSTNMARKVVFMIFKWLFTYNQYHNKLNSVVF